MRVQKAWVKALGVEPTTYHNWTLQVPQNESITFWCLERGLIRSHDYFAWAVEYFGLPVLKQEFFQQHKVHHNLWNKIQKVANWSPALLPFDEWDGVIFLACVEQPDDIQWSFPVQYVLAHPQHLKTYWDQLHQPPPSSMASPESPQGLNLNIIPPSSSPASSSDNSTTAVPEGLFLNHVKPPDAAATIVGPAKKPTSAPRLQLSNVNQNHPSTYGPLDADQLAPSSIETAQSETEAVAWCFQQLKQYFKFSWLLFKQEESLRPYRWESSARLAEPSSSDQEAVPLPIELKEPSLFRIVTRTRMPYHGHVVESPTNSHFFKQWGLLTIPPHVTAIPLMVDQHMIAILVCAGDKPTHPDDVLKFTEKIATRLLPLLGKQNQKAAA